MLPGIHFHSKNPCRPLSGNAAPHKKNRSALRADRFLRYKLCFAALRQNQYSPVPQSSEIVMIPESLPSGRMILNSGVLHSFFSSIFLPPYLPKYSFAALL